MASLRSPLVLSLSLLLSLLLLLLLPPALAGSYSDDTFSLDWGISGDEITFRMSAPTLGYVALGIGADSAYPHLHADSYVGWVTPGQVTLIDGKFPGGEVQPKEDPIQSATLIAGWEENGVTTIIFKRKLDTGDSNDVVIGAGRYKLLMSMSPSDGHGTSFVKHTIQSPFAVDFLSNPNPSPTSSPPPPLPPATFTSGSFSLSWTINDTSSEITFTMSAATAGWVGIGISATSNPSPHQNADMYVGWVSGDKVTLLDCTGTKSPRVDSVQSVTLISGNETGGRTTITFKRPLNGIGPNLTINSTNLYFLWAYCKADGQGSFLPQHNSKGTSRINFLNPIIGAGAPEITSLRSGELLVIATGILFVAYVVIRFARRLIKSWKVRLASKDWQSLEDNREPVRTFTVISARPHHFAGKEGSPQAERRDLEESPSGEMELLPAATPGELPSPDPPSEQPATSLGILKGLSFQPTSSAHVMEQSAGVLGAKPKGHHLSNYLRGVGMHRLPGTHIALDHLLVALVFLGLNCAALFLGTGPSYATRVGSLAAANSLLVAIPATRNSVLVFLLGISFDRVIMFHRWMGYWTLIVVTVHFILEMLASSAAGEVLREVLFGTLTNVYGFVAWLCTVTLFLSSLALIRRRFFEVFFYLHFLFLGYFVLGALHSDVFLPYAIAAASFYFLDRLIRLFWGLWPVRATLHVKAQEAGDREYQIIQVTFPKNPLGVLFKAYTPGQYVFVNFPGVSLLEWHPFSVTSGPDEQVMELHIRSLGNHTTKLLEAAMQPNGHTKWIRVDGPYGNLNVNLRRFPNLVLVAGGIGFAPVIGILKDIYRVGRLTPKLAQIPASVIKTVHVVWVARSPGQYSWFHEEMEALAKAAQENNLLPALHANISISGAKPADPAFLDLLAIQTPKVEVLFHCGRPDFEKITERTISGAGANMVFVCGPQQMVSSFWDNCTRASRKGARIRFHHEIFEF